LRKDLAATECSMARFLLFLCAVFLLVKGESENNDFKKKLKHLLNDI
jgi:hypothetical protein